MRRASDDVNSAARGMRGAFVQGMRTRSHRGVLSGAKRVHFSRPLADCEPEIMCPLAPPPRRRIPSNTVLSPRLSQFARALSVRVSLDDARVHALDEAAHEADPLADALAAFITEGHAGEGRRVFEQALRHGIDSVSDAPVPLRAFFAQAEQVPAWLDREHVALGARAMQRHGPDLMIALSAVLMSGYLTDGATKPLVATGALTQLAPQRLDATARFVYDVCMSDMGRFSAGFMTTLRVRLMHAMVRRSLLASPAWHAERWGIPINQRDLIVTHLQFTATYLGATLALGRIDTRVERHALLHLWRYVSYLLGVRDDLLPKNVREGVELLEIFNLTESGPDADSVALAQALMQAWLNGPPSQGPLGDKIGKFLLGNSRYFLGAASSRALGIPNTGWRFAPPVVALCSLPLEVTQWLSPRARALGVDWGKARIARAFRPPGQVVPVPKREPYALKHT